jgi:hypothetical protein
LTVKHIKTNNIEVISSTYPVSENSETSLKFAIIKSKGSAFEDALLGKNAEDAMRLLLTAVNNRTRERNFFRLYCDYLDGSISENEYNKELDEHISEYMVSQNEVPDEDKLELALKIAKQIKDVSSIEDFAALFSFDGGKVKQLSQL